jgi:dihydropteroate synthase
VTGILGIVNLTEDSFSDGGLYLDPERAIAHARQLARDGADVIDLGPASSRPEAREVGAEQEIQRLAPVIAALRAEGIAVSVDSWRTETQRFALAQRVEWLNDIRGFPDPELHGELAAASCRLVVMHSVQRGSRATRVETDPSQVWDGLLEFFDERIQALERAGIERGRLVLDPGMGHFLGSAPEPSLLVLRRLLELRRRFGCELLVSVSRKSFLGALTGRPTRDRGAATLAAELHAACHGAGWIRTHDVRALRDALRVAEALAAP